ncbi:MAG: single-stranded DNA-binding protein [Candidatus Cloacimonetes bacterium]|nr:single-stranded DNA-binding protein [Candidatus Cloacimonadota bacterium]
MSGYLRFPNINEVTISGRLVRDVEMKYLQNNVGFAKICIAVNYFYKDENGNFVEQPSFVDTIAYGKIAQNCTENLKKGSPVIIQGYLKTRTFTDQNNVTKKMTEVNITRVYPLERDENYVPNSEYRQSSNPNNNSNYSASPKPATANNPEEPDSFPTYDPNEFGSVNTDNDVPF